MCGIIGSVGDDRLLQREFERLVNLMTHRGPDSTGIWNSGATWIGHRRLSIIDIAGSPQPMVSADGRYVLTYNGELYNFREIKTNLLQRGVTFRTSGDTEVVLQALIVFGADALKTFNGMFALGFWDNLEKRLLLARDRIGVKPLFYSVDGNQIAFASEYPPLTAIPRVDRTPDRLAIRGYLAHSQTTFNSRTIYKGISEVVPGTYLTFQGGRLETKRYWSLPKIATSDKIRNWDESKIRLAKEEVYRLMRNAVKRQLVADVEVGSFLSGGIDSAILTTLMAREMTDRVKAFSIGFQEEGFHEFQYSKALVRDLNLRHDLVTMSKEDYLSGQDFLISHKGSPLSTPNEVPIYALAKHVSGQLKVVLTGEGSDELFGGYAALLRAPFDFLLAEKVSKSPQLFDAKARELIRKSNQRLYGKIRFRNETDHWLTCYAWNSTADIGTVMGAEDELELQEEAFGFWEEELKVCEGMDTYDRYLYLLETIHLKGLLHRLDACTMAGSIEGRVPFTDNELIDFVWQLPFEYKLRWNEGVEPGTLAGMNSLEIAGNYDTGKWLLKKTFENAIADVITNRKKQAFPVPLEQWYSGNEADNALRTITEASQSDQAVLSNATPDWARQTLASGNGAMKFWMVYNLAKWMQNSEKINP